MYATIAERKTVAYDAPGGKPIETFGTHNVNGHVTVFGVRRVVLNEDCKIEWYRVWLPMRPNGSEGYVHADDVRLVRRERRITIDLSDRELVLYREGEPVLRSTVAIGAPGTPTPTGRYYVNQRLIAGDPTARGAPARSASRRSRTSSRSGSRAGRSPSTARTTRRRSATRPRTAASACRTTC